MKNVHKHKISMVIAFLTFVAIRVPSLQAQNATEPLFLFSTSDEIEIPGDRIDLQTRLSKFRNLRETAAVKTINISNFDNAVDAATIRLELEGRAIIVDRNLEKRIGDGKDSKHFWQGTSFHGDELDLVFWQGRLSGHLLTQNKYYKIRSIEGAIYALIEIRQLAPTLLGCDTPEDREQEAALPWKAKVPVSSLKSVGASKTSSAQQYTRVLVLYTEKVLDVYGEERTIDDDLVYTFGYMDMAFDATDAYTRPQHVGTELLEDFVEPTSWSNSGYIWNTALASYYDDIFELREQYTADVVMLILDDESSSPCCHGSSRTDNVTDIDDAIFYVDVPYVDNTKYHTPSHEMGHMFGSPGSHSDGYYIRDASFQDVYSACYTGYPNYWRSTRTLMFAGSGGTYERRANYYASNGETFSHLCPDEYPPIPSFHTFKLGDSPSHNTENSRIEANEDDVSNFWEDLGESSMAAKDGTRDPETLGNTASLITVESYPNPFNPQTTIRFTLPEETYVRLTVFDVLGREIRVLVDGTQVAGTHDVHFDGSRLPSGIYFYRLTATGENGPHEGTGHLTLLR